MFTTVLDVMHALLKERAKDTGCWFAVTLLHKSQEVRGRSLGPGRESSLHDARQSTAGKSYLYLVKINATGKMGGC